MTKVKKGCRVWPYTVRINNSDPKRITFEVQDKTGKTVYMRTIGGAK